MALSEESKKYLDSLSDEELELELSLRYGVKIPIWKEVTKEEYEANYGKEDDYSFSSVMKWLNCPNTYKREPHWNNVEAGILWQIEHYDTEPDYYTYYKLVKEELTLILCSDILNYLNTRKPDWLNKFKR